MLIMTFEEMYRGGRVQVRSVELKRAWPQGTINGRWFFSVKNSPTALNVQQDQQEGEKDQNISLKPCLCPPEASRRTSSMLSRAPAGRQNENMSEKFKRRKTISTF